MNNRAALALGALLMFLVLKILFYLIKRVIKLSKPVMTMVKVRAGGVIRAGDIVHIDPDGIARTVKIQKLDEEDEEIL